MGPPARASEVSPQGLTDLPGGWSRFLNLRKALIYGYVDISVPHCLLYLHRTEVCLKANGDLLTDSTAYQNCHAAHSSVHTHVCLMQGHEVFDSDVAVRTGWLRQKGRLRPKLICHSLHLF